MDSFFAPVHACVRSSYGIFTQVARDVHTSRTVRSAALTDHVVLPARLAADNVARRVLRDHGCLALDCARALDDHAHGGSVVLVRVIEIDDGERGLVAGARPSVLFRQDELAPRLVLLLLSRGQPGDSAVLPGFFLQLEQQLSLLVAERLGTQSPLAVLLRQRP